MDLLNSLVNSDRHTCANIGSQTSAMMLSSQQRRLSQGDTEALAVGLASSQQYSNSPRLMENSTPVNSYTPPPSAQSHQNENAPPTSLGLRLQSIADFDKENPYIPKAKKATISPPPKDGNGAGSVAQFYSLRDIHGIQPDFRISEVLGEGFRAKVVLGKLVEQLDHSYPSKQAAKEAVCQLAIPHLVAIPTKTGTKRKAASPVVEVDTSENWIGILQEFTQQEKLLNPDYVALPNATNQFTCSCTVTFGDGLPKVFDTSGRGFHSKQGAKATAAKEAVLWLREQHKLPPAGSKRSKVLPACQTGLTQAMNAFAMEPTEKVTVRMNKLIQSLGLHAPTYDMQASSSSSEQGGLATGYWDIAVIFDARDVEKIPRLGGRSGEVKHVFGKAKAKEACSQRVVQLLEEIEAERIS